MIKIKLKLALIIDSFMAALFVSPIILLTMDWENSIGLTLFNLLVTMPLIYCFFMFSPLIFRNASIGMKVMHLKIVDNNFNVPSVRLILKRWVMFPKWSVDYFKSIFTGSDMDNWELKNLGTQIVSTKINKNV